MNLQEQHHGAVTVIRPDGPLTGSDAEQLEKRFLEVIDESMGRTVLDVSAIPFTDSRGLEALVTINETMARSGQVLRLCGVNETLRQVLDLTDLDSDFEHYEDLSMAVRSFL